MPFSFGCYHHKSGLNVSSVDHLLLSLPLVSQPQFLSANELTLKAIDEEYITF